MVFRSGRRNRPGLLGTVARTAVITGTAQATSNAMNRRGQQRTAEQHAAPAAPVAAPAPAGDDLVSKLQQLGQLHQSGVLSDDEFTAAKAQLLG